MVQSKAIKILAEYYQAEIVNGDIYLGEPPKGNVPTKVWDAWRCLLKNIKTPQN